MKLKMYLAILSKENPELSAYEAISLGKLKSFKREEELILFSKPFPFQHLAYTRQVAKVIMTCAFSKLHDCISRANLQKYYKGSYAARIIKTSKATFSLTEKELGSLIWNRLKQPRVDLEHPKTTYLLVISKRHAHLCLPIWENNEDFNARKSHLLPAPHPTGMHPRLARALVNILGTKSFLDPFCGAGGLLIEGGLLGIKAKGSDIDPIQVRRARINLDSIGLHHIPVSVGDATQLSRRAAGIVTDLPYGKNTRSLDAKGTYNAFLQKASQKTCRMVIVFPSSIKPLIPPGFHVEKTFTYYLHRSLSKRIVILAASYTAPRAHRHLP
ncbi:MAG: hypothetical protein ABIJ21_05485 [Nanoarchaeota archaeon]